MRTLPLVLLLAASPALAQTELYGVGSGFLIHINKATGVGTPIGSGIGLGAGNSAASDPAGRIFTDGGPDQLVLVDPITGAGSVALALTNRPIPYGIRGMAFTPSGELFVVMSQSSVTTIDLLCRIDTTTGAYTIIGPTGRADLQALASDSSGTLYAIAITNTGGLFTIDKTTGLATSIGGAGALGPDNQALEFDTDGTLFAARDNLRTVNPATGGTISIIGAIGPFDVRGLAIVPTGPAPCYPNCDGSTVPPILNVSDFICFQTKYAAGDPYANCDNSTVPPILNVSDFICFQNLYAAGCS